jgi:uncharacterized protein (TIRG00374 family)
MLPNQEGERGMSQADAPRTHRGLNLRGIVQLIVGLVALGLVLIKSDTGALIEAMKHTRLAYLPLAVAASFTVTWLMAYRWGMILRARGVRFATRTLFVYYLIGIFFTSFVPGGGISGDVARLIYIDREVRNKALVLSTLVYERLIGVFTLLLIGFAATLATRVYAQTDRVIYIGEAVLAISFAAIAILMSGFVTSRLARMLRAIGARLKAARIGEAAARTLEDILKLRRDVPLLIRTLLMSLVIRIVWSLGCYVIVWAMGLPLGVFTLFAFISLVDLVRLMPISVGGLGVREWIVIVLFATAGISREQALTFSFLAFAPIYLNAIVGGIIYIATAKLRTIRQGGEVEIAG